MADLDTKALEAAMAAFDTFTKAIYDEFHATHRVKQHTSAIVHAYLSALPKPSDEVAGVVKRLREIADFMGASQIMDDEMRAGDRIQLAATLLEALDAELRALRSPGD